MPTGVRPRAPSLRIREAFREALASKETIDFAGMVQTRCIKGLASSTYTAEIVDLVHAKFDWNQLLDPNGDDEDADGDRLSDDVFTLL